MVLSWNILKITKVIIYLYTKYLNFSDFSKNSPDDTYV
ncbi:hypothetical protein HNP94_001365 [Methanococcus maripaludis]|uniref:Uncharacterized protein n=1 Tax=Methanococcus maripaludis TaxID=39152 RepID=A0A7J9PMC9_METMI|nr:hypothetical protein [Methanococcus maripaludis]